MSDLPIQRDDRLRANHRLLNALTQLWDEHPYMRFGQLVMNPSREPLGGFEDTWEWKHGQWLGRMGKAYTDWGALSTESALQRTTPEPVSDRAVLRPPTPEGGET